MIPSNLFAKLKPMKKTILGLVLLVLVTVGTYLFWADFEGQDDSANGKKGSLSFLNLPDGFDISVAVKNLDNPRVIIFDPKGRMLISETKAGRVSVLEDKNNDGVFEKQDVLVEGLKSPHGLAFYRDSKTGTDYLYIAETHQVARYRYDISAGKLLDITGTQITKLPEGGRHFTRTIAFGPNFRTNQIVSGIGGINTQVDTKLYTSVGSSCDVCEENTWKRAAILESDPEGSYTAEFAGGLRNSVFFTFHPVTKEIWATEMGRDNLGDDLPPDEINIVKVAGPEHKFGARRYGWPFCYGDKVRDKTFKPDKWERIDVTDDCSITESPVIKIPAHSAPLGLVFVPSNAGWPKEWEGNLLVAFHGSRNRNEPTGYKIVRYDLDKNGKVLSQVPADFISGWLETKNQKPKTKNQVYGRPVDLKFGPFFDKSSEGKPDGALYVSDDMAGVIYRIKAKN